MVDLFSHHRPNDADIVRHFAVPRQEVADELATLTILAKLCQMPLNLQCRSLQLSDRLPGGERLRHRLTVHFVKLRFVIERLKMRWSSSHAEEDHPFSLTGEVWKSISLAGTCTGGRATSHESSQGRRSKSHSGVGKKRATVDACVIEH